MNTNEELFEKIRVTLGNLEGSEKLKNLIQEALTRKIAITDIIERGLRRGLEEVGKRYEAGEYFLSELLFSASMMNEIMNVLTPHLEGTELKKRGVIVLGTVKDDIHDIGKNIFKMFAQASGFEVHDLGVDVDAQKFVEKLKETKAKILALSALLTTTRDEMKVVVDTLVQSGIRNDVKILLGGNAVDKKFAEEIGADAAAMDAVEGVEICKGWTGEKQ